MSFDYDSSPPMLVLLSSVLDATQVVVEFLTHWSRLVAEYVALACLHVVDA